MIIAQALIFLSIHAIFSGQQAYVSQWVGTLLGYIFHFANAWEVRNTNLQSHCGLLRYGDLCVHSLWFAFQMFPPGQIVLSTSNSPCQYAT